MPRPLSARARAVESNTTPLQQPWLWESCEEHFRLGFKSPEFWRAFNSWNWSYWLLQLILVFPWNLWLPVLGSNWSAIASERHAVELPILVLLLVGGCIALCCAPQRGHTVMSCVVATMFILHYVSLALQSQECHSGSNWHFGCAQTLVLWQPPLFLVVFVFSTCRLRPVVPVIICGICCAVSLAWSLFTSLRHLLSKEGATLKMQEAHTAIGSVFCGVACIFGAQAGAFVFRRQREIFEYLIDHLTITKTVSDEGFDDLSYEIRGVGDGTTNFFQQYINRLFVLSFPGPEASAEERRFQEWRLHTAQDWLNRRVHYFCVGIAAITVPYLGLCWDEYTRGHSLLPVAAIQTVAMVVTFASAVSLRLCPTAKRQWAMGTNFLAQLVFCVSFLLSGPPTEEVEPSLHVVASQQPLWPSDPFMFLIFSAHSMWRLGVCPILLFDCGVLCVFLALCCLEYDRIKSAWGEHVFPLMSAQLVLTIAECLSLTLTLEKYDRILWKLHNFANESWFTPSSTFVTEPLARLPTQDSMAMYNSGSGLRISVLGFSTQFSDEVFYFIECEVEGWRPEVVLRTVAELRAGFCRLLEQGRAGLISIPFLDCSFDGLADATEQQIWHAARRLERVLRRGFQDPGVARAALGIRNPTELGSSTLVSTRSKVVPKLDVLILCVGSRGDVQPFISLARALTNTGGHRCRLATHGEFEQLVKDAGVEFYPLAQSSPDLGHWQPRQLMEHMEQNPGMGPEVLWRPRDLLRMLVRAPGMSNTLQQLVLPNQPENAVGEFVVGPWAAAIQPTPDTRRPFTAQAVIANPPSFAHVHIAERLGIPCHMAFTMPWTPTSVVGHPMSSSAAAQGESNSFWHRMSYRWVDNLQWSAARFGSYINNFRRQIGLPPISAAQYGPSIVDDLRIPFMYFWSEALLQKPRDWGPHIDVCGFVEERGASFGSQPAALLAFLEAGPPPVYIGFGSVSSDLQRIAQDVVTAATRLGHRVVLQRGWGSLGELPADLPDDVFYVGGRGDEESSAVAARIAAGSACTGALDHEWLFSRCLAVCHHGGCGTMQCGMRHGRPTLVVAFFGDQPLWGGLIQHKGAGRLLLARSATLEKFSDAMRYVCSEEAREAAGKLQEMLARDRTDGAGLPAAVEAFHRQLPLELLDCDICHYMSADPHGAPHRVRLARLYDANSQLRLCDVCCYALFLHDNRPLLPANHLAMYRAMDWGRGQRRWLRALGASTVNAMEGVVSMPFVGLRSGGLVGAALGGVAGLLTFLAAPVTGARHVANQLRGCIRSASSSHADGLGDHLAYLRHNSSGSERSGGSVGPVQTGRLRLCSSGDSLQLHPRAQPAGAAPSSPADELSPPEADAACAQIRKAFHDVMAFRRRVAKMQECGHQMFASELATGGGGAGRPSCRLGCQFTGRVCGRARVLRNEDGLLLSRGISLNG